MKSGRRYRYYVSKRLIGGTVSQSPDQAGWRIPAREIERVELDADRIAVSLNLSSMTGLTDTIIRHVVPTRLKRRGVEIRPVLEGNDIDPSKPEPALIKAIARAHKWFDDLLKGRARSLSYIAKAERVSDRYVSALMPLAFLAPDIVEAILTGTQPADLTPRR